VSHLAPCGWQPCNGAAQVRDSPRAGRADLNKGAGSPTLSKRAEQLEFIARHNMRKRDRDMISVDLHARQSTYRVCVGDALADVELKYGDRCPPAPISI